MLRETDVCEVEEISRTSSVQASIEILPRRKPSGPYLGPLPKPG